jgi:hypothetical protein
MTAYTLLCVHIAGLFVCLFVCLFVSYACLNKGVVSVSDVDQLGLDAICFL